MSRTRQGLLVVMMEPEDGYEDTLNEWYETEHLAERLSCPGFLRARRFMAIEGSPKYLALYDLSSVDDVKSDQYRAHKEQPTALTTLVQQHLKQFHRAVYVEIPRSTGEPT